MYISLIKFSYIAIFTCKSIWEIHLFDWQKNIFCCCSVTKSCLTLCTPWTMNYSIPGFPILHCLPEFVQTHVHWVDDAIQPPHPLSSPSSLALKSFPVSGSFPISRLFASGGQSIEASASAPVLLLHIQGWFPLGLTGLISLLSIKKSLHQHHSSKASILQCSAFFIA